MLSDPIVFTTCYKELGDWLNKNKEEWLMEVLSEKRRDEIHQILSIWNDDSIGHNMLKIAKLSEFDSIVDSISEESRLKLLEDINHKKERIIYDRHEFTNEIQDKNNHIKIDTDNLIHTKDSSISSNGEFNYGGFFLSSHGIDGIPESVTPLIIRSSRNSYCPSIAQSPKSHEVPRHTKDATILLKQIGKGGSAAVMQGLYVPTLTMLAIKSVPVESPSIRNQMLTELKALYSLSRYSLKPSTMLRIPSTVIKQPVAKPNTIDSNICRMITPVCLKDSKDKIISEEKQPDTWIINHILHKGFIFDTMTSIIAGVGILLIYSFLFCFHADVKTTIVILLATNFICHYNRIIDLFLGDDFDYYNIFDSDYMDSDHMDTKTSIIRSERMKIQVETTNKDREKIENQSILKKEDSPLLEGTNMCRYIVKFYDAYTDSSNRSVCIVLEHMDGGSLQTLINKNITLNEDNIAVVAYSVIQALIELHKRNIIHRDIKPGNILFDHYGHVKLSDFGIVREMSDQKSSTDTFTGTIQYMSPERINGEKYSYKSDIWSLGITLAALIKAKSPFSKAQGYWGLVDAIHNEPNDITSIKGVHLSDFISKCLRPDPSKRPDAITLLNHPFLREAYSRGVIKPPIQPTLRGLHVEPVSENRVYDIVEKILEWYLFRINDQECKKVFAETCGLRERNSTKLFDKIWFSDICTSSRLEWLGSQLQYDTDKLENIFHIKIDHMNSLLKSVILELNRYLVTNNHQIESANLGIDLSDQNIELPDRLTFFVDSREKYIPLHNAVKIVTRVALKGIPITVAIDKLKDIKTSSLSQSCNYVLRESNFMGFAKILPHDMSCTPLLHETNSGKEESTNTQSSCPSTLNCDDVVKSIIESVGNPIVNMDTKFEIGDHTQNTQDVQQFEDTIILKSQEDCSKDIHSTDHRDAINFTTSLLPLNSQMISPTNSIINLDGISPTFHIRSRPKSDIGDSCPIHRVKSSFSLLSYCEDTTSHEFFPCPLSSLSSLDPIDSSSHHRNHPPLYESSEFSEAYGPQDTGNEDTLSSTSTEVSHRYFGNVNSKNNYSRAGRTNNNNSNSTSSSSNLNIFASTISDIDYTDTSVMEIYQVTTEETKLDDIEGDNYF